MIKNDLKSGTIYILGVISVAMLFLAGRMKTFFQIETGEQGDETYIRNLRDTESSDDPSSRWSHDNSPIFARLTTRLPSKQGSEIKEVSV